MKKPESIKVGQIIGFTENSENSYFNQEKTIVRIDAIDENGNAWAHSVPSEFLNEQWQGCPKICLGPLEETNKGTYFFFVPNEEEEKLCINVEANSTMEIEEIEFLQNLINELNAGRGMNDIKTLIRQRMKVIESQQSQLEELQKENEALSKDLKIQTKFKEAYYGHWENSNKENTKLENRVKELEELVIDYDNGVKSLLQKHPFREYSHVSSRKEELLTKD